MAENSGIEWTDHTFSPWWGCFEVSPACDHCYARTLAARFGVDWGPEARLRFASERYWEGPVRWNRKAEKEGVRRRVFCASMADVLDLRPPTHPDFWEIAIAQNRLWSLIEATPFLDWLLLTKRPKYAERLFPAHWYGGQWPKNAWMGVTVENQEYADERIPLLLKIPAPVRFLSCEPLLGPVDLTMVALRPALRAGHETWIDALAGAEYVCDEQAEVDVEINRIHWVIAGGESGPDARASSPDWFTSLRDQCVAAGVPFHFKQWGEYAPGDGGRVHRGPVPRYEPPLRLPDGTLMTRVGKKNAGRILSGRTWDEFPAGISPA